MRVQVFIAYLAGISERADLKLLYDAFAKLLNNPLQVPPARWSAAMNRTRSTSSPALCTIARSTGEPPTEKLRGHIVQSHRAVRHKPSGARTSARPA